VLAFVRHRIRVLGGQQELADSIRMGGTVILVCLLVFSQSNTDVTFSSVDSTCECALPSVTPRARAEATASNGSRRIRRSMVLAVEEAPSGSTSTSSRGSTSRALCSACQRR
jgi:hypothetical protein